MSNCFVVDKRGMSRCRYCGIKIGEKHLFSCKFDKISINDKETKDIEFAQQLEDGFRLLEMNDESN